VSHSGESRFVIRPRSGLPSLPGVFVGLITPNLCYYCIIFINTVKRNLKVVSLVVAMGYNPIFFGHNSGVDCTDNYDTFTVWPDH
jgi:hypothetical protein